MRSYRMLTEAVFHNEIEQPHRVSVPHTWNAFDGQDGGLDYHRGVGVYEFALPEPTAQMRQFVEIRGANHIAEVFVNGQLAGRHEGGFSTFRFDVSELLKPHGNTMTVTVDNTESHVYPQKADFTFFGGLYRPVYWIEVPQAHFDLSYFGTDGLFVTPKADGTTEVCIRTVQADGLSVLCEITDGETLCCAETIPAKTETKCTLRVENPHLWNGREDAHLYTLTAKLMDGETELDRVRTRIGYRSFSLDANTGFYLNGKSYPLHGVCRHQDREDMGWAIGKHEHLQDMQLICEVGANSIRLAHYQHDQFFYDLCDEYGMVVWAEIPVISKFLFGEKSRENSLSQMRELILQNYNHPAICFWGIANETTICKNSPELEENLHALHALSKQLDPTRPTTMAHLASVQPGHPHTDVTDIHAINYYFGWYSGVIADNGPKMDAMHESRPDKPFAISEYGVDNVICWHSAHPINHDYSEEYAVEYHHQLLKIFAERPYLWATYMWNMFDFASDQRDEGGVKGRNCKGLMTYDRKTKKDSFFVYQAFWSHEPMVHISGSRFKNRAPGERTVSVFTNQPEVTLTLNGTVIGTKQAIDCRADFEELPLQDGENTVCVSAGKASDECTLCGVSAHDEAYDLPDVLASQKAGNWFSEAEEAEELPEGERYDADDTIGELMSNEQTARIVKGWLMAKASAPLDFRLLCTLRLDTQRYESPDSKLREKKKSIGAIMTDEDYEVLNRRLHTVPKKK